MTVEELKQKAEQSDVEEVVRHEIAEGNMSDNDINNYLELLGENGKTKLEEIFENEANEFEISDEEHIALLVKAGYDSKDLFLGYIWGDVKDHSIYVAEEFCVNLSEAYIKGTFGLQKNNQKAWLALESLMDATAFYSGEYYEDATGVVIERMIVNYLKGEFNNTHLKRAVEMIGNYHFNFDIAGFSPLETLVHFLLELTGSNIEEFQNSSEYQDAKNKFENRVYNGDNETLYDLAFCYEVGLGCAVNKKLALDWYKKSAEQGNKNAQFRIALFHINGSGIEKNQQKGIEILEKFAEKNDPFALRNLALIYYKGIGIEKHITKAKEYFIKATEQGDEVSKNYLNKFEEAHQNYLNEEQRNTKKESANSSNNSGCLGVFLVLVALSSSLLFTFILLTL